MSAGNGSHSDGRPDLLAPTLLSGRYRLDARIGQGGVGTVWRARDLQLDRDVAVKVLRPDVVRDPVAVDRFRREALAAASVSHPSLVTIFDVGDDDGTVFLVMALVTGRSLKEVLATGGPLAPGEAATIGHRVAGALAEVHACGLVHRDVKPGNVLLSVDGPVRLVDFGTVHVLDEADATLTLPGTMLGTIGYVAPEQLEGRAVDPRADVFAVGLLLHESLTGAPTFGTGSIAELTRRRVADDVEPPSTLRPDVPADLDAVVVRATQRDPDARYPDAEALARALAPLVPRDGEQRLQAVARRHVDGGADDGAPPVPVPPPDVEVTTVLVRDGHPRSTPDPDDTGERRPAAVDSTSVLPALLPDAEPVGGGAPPTTEQRRRVVVPLLLLGLLAVLVAVFGLDRLGGPPAPEGAAGRGGDEGTPLTVAGASDFDPFGGGSEHPEDVPLAHDGDPGTFWNTEGYNQADLAPKPGVGMWVQAADGATPTRVEIDLAIPGADISVYALDAAPAGEPDDWGEPIGTAADAEGTVAFEVPEGTGNVVLVWFTKLGPDGGRFRGAVAEVRLLP